LLLRCAGSTDYFTVHKRRAASGASAGRDQRTSLGELRRWLARNKFPVVTTFRNGSLLKRFNLHRGLFTPGDAAWPARPYTATRLKTWRIVRGRCKANVQLTAAHTNVRCSSTCLSVVRRHDAPFGGDQQLLRAAAAANPTPRAHVPTRPWQRAANSSSSQPANLDFPSIGHHCSRKLTIVYAVVLSTLCFTHRQ